MTHRPTVNDPLREYGHWSYLSGTGTQVAVVDADHRVVGITATAGSGGGSIVIDSGMAIPIPANGSVDIEPKGNLVSPEITFDSTAAFMVELVDWVT